MNEVLKMAAWYIQIGWSLIPINPDTKIPALPSWKEYMEHQASIETVGAWVRKGLHLAAVTGDISGILVVDDDRVKHGLTEWGFESPVSSRTQNNGKHYFFKYDRELHSHSNTLLRLDLKAWHSYVLLPPFNGREWINKPSLDNLAKLTPLADEIVRLINSDTRDRNGIKKPIILSDFVAVKDGGRNDSLHAIACSLFNKHLEKDAIQILSGINQTYFPPLTQSEFEYQVSKALSFVKSNPKDKVQISDRSEKPTPATPLSLAIVAARRSEDRLLELDAPSTGYPELDELVKGFLPKHFWTLTGETNVGKTALGCNLAENVRRQGKRALYVALEPEYKVVDYLASIRLGKKFRDLTEEDIQFDDGLISIFTLAEVPTYKALIESLKENSTKYDVVIIDHIGYFCRSSQESSFLQEQAQTIRDLVQFSKDSRTCVIAIAHPRKPSISQKSRILSLYDISGTAAFAQDSTEVISIYRPPIDEANPMRIELSNAGLLLVQKSKSGANGSVRIEFRGDTALIETTESVQGPALNLGQIREVFTDDNKFEL